MRLKGKECTYCGKDEWYALTKKSPTYNTFGDRVFIMTTDLTCIACDYSTPVPETIKQMIKAGTMRECDD